MLVESIPFNAPASGERVRSLLERLGLKDDSRALDVGCGRGEMLAQLAESYRCAVVGVDPRADEIAIAGRRLAHSGAEVALHPARLDDVELGSDFDAALCVGASQAFATGPGSALAALSALARRVCMGGKVLLGEGYWRREPSASYLAGTGMAKEDMLSHAQTASLGSACGLRLLHAEECSAEEWDVFERAFLAEAERALQAAPSDAAVRGQHAHWSSWHALYQREGRDTLGFGFYVFERGEAPTDTDLSAC